MNIKKNQEKKDKNSHGHHHESAPKRGQYGGSQDERRHEGNRRNKGDRRHV